MSTSARSRTRTASDTIAVPAAAPVPIPPAVTLAELAELARWRTSPCVTVMVPIDRRHPNYRLEHGALDRLLEQATESLERRGFDSAAVLVSLREVADRPVLAEHGGTMVWFCAPDFAVEMVVGAPLHPLCVVGNRFEVSPLLPSVDASIGGHVLAIGSEHVKLYHIDAAELHECTVADLPTSLDDDLWYERFERHSGAHTVGNGPQGGSVRIGHGSGAQREDRKARLDRFFHHVDNTVLDHIGDTHVHPLMVAGSSTALARYRSVSRHPWLVTVDVGSTVRFSTDELRRRVAAQVASETSLVDLVDRLHRRMGTGLASADFAEILTAAAEGRVANLFLGGAEPWWAMGLDSTERLPAQTDTAIDLVNLAVSDALRSHASVHLVSPAQLPGAAPVAALFRY